MGPQEYNQINDLLDSMISILNSVLPNNTSLVYGSRDTDTFREQLAELRKITGEMIHAFPVEHFPIVSRAIRAFSNGVDNLVEMFPGDTQSLLAKAEGLKTSWHVGVRPSIYALENALSVSPGIFLPDDPNLFTGKDRYLRDITIEINTCFRQGAYNGCSVMLRRLLETLIIKAHTRNGSVAMATDANGEFFHLDKLIDDVIRNRMFGLSRNALQAMPNLKRLGDWGAHNPNMLVRRSVDLEPIKAQARLCFEELLSKV